MQQKELSEVVKGASFSYNFPNIRGIKSLTYTKKIIAGQSSTFYIVWEIKPLRPIGCLIKFSIALVAAHL